jgi:hypothetical protein
LTLSPASEISRTAVDQLALPYNSDSDMAIKEMKQKMMRYTECLVTSLLFIGLLVCFLFQVKVQVLYLKTLQLSATVRSKTTGW